ncbi:FecR family protein [Olivibacter sp. SDN3]|uniref:FecR family protein n=1 Tax=Olivibacter sp. SDN3 TaxID=2764720 RepID=UPI0016517CBF|nr:FecR family protein [Olivibacter sp. SDN3]QNL49380.1 FecR family protein [Olivibacter sp. SDN3]
MKDRSDQLYTLLCAYMTEKITEAEFEQLIQLMQENQGDIDESTLASAIDRAWKCYDQDQPIRINADKVYSKILADDRIKPSVSKQRKKNKYIFWMPTIGAAALICIGIFLFIQHSSRQPLDSDISSLSKNIDSNSIQPGNNKATLILADGKAVALESMEEGMLSFQAGENIKKEGNQLIYMNTDQQNGNEQERLNTIHTPAGGEFALTLPDGTKVWLNAQSSLTYPTSFSSHQKNRAVKLVGEAYFDVAKNKDRPFIVEANGTAIKVLGTQFNVNAYLDEKTIKTTLIEGSVLVKSKKLKPGQQAISFSETENLLVHDIDVQEATAWRNGYFFFDDEDIKTVMNTIARWYDITVEYQGDLNGKTFGGTISRYEDFHKLLQVIELTESVHFQTKGRRVMVSP